MNLLKPLLPTIRVWVFGAVVWLLAKLGLPDAQAMPITDWVMDGVVLVATIVYGLWAGWRDSKLKLIERTAALPEVAKVVTTPELARKVDDPAVTAG